ncbi:hypothetical protein [Paraburkholderia fungorum]|uniref:hypothetical protein n=1 Tax=Paraburkholderia fungorum TaxID=134537 RepID=UPI0038BB0EC8
MNDMGANDLTLDLDALRGDILRKTGQKIDLDDPLMAVVVLIDHCVRANLIAARDAADACRAMVEKGADSEPLLALSASLTKQIQTLRGDLANVAALAKPLSGQQARTASGGPDTTAFLREIADIDRRLASLISANESASTSNKALVAKIELQLEQLSGSMRQWSETVGKSLPRAISAEIRASEWRTAGKFGLIFVVLYVARLFIVHKFGLPI